MIRARRRREDARVDAFLAVIRGTGTQPATHSQTAHRTDTVSMPRIVLRTATPPGGWATVATDLQASAAAAARCAVVALGGLLTVAQLATPGGLI